MSAIAPEVEAIIRTRLDAVEQEHQVRILLAVESGSRAWGFASPDSDYDIRFIYVHPRDWYLSIAPAEQPDVIEYPIVDLIDLNGWELRKALRLFRNSNPTFAEWIQSPIRYREAGTFSHRIRQLLPDIYSCSKGIGHYRSMARSNYRKYLLGSNVPLKKYLYALRPLLAARWLDYYQTPAPMEFRSMLGLIADQPLLVAQIEALLLRKETTPEMGTEPPVPILQQFIEEELAKTQESPLPLLSSAQDLALLNHLFQDQLQEAWSNHA